MSEQPDHPDHPDRIDFAAGRRAFVRQRFGSGPMGWLMPLLLVNLAILLVRPQHSLPLIGQLYIPLALGLLPLPFVIANGLRLWKGEAQIRAMLLFLVLGAAWVPLAHNNFYAYSAFRDVAQQFLCYFFPLYLFMCTGTQLRRVLAALMLCGVYLAVYGILHSGRGPGGHLGDENDLCLALLAVFGIPLALFSQVKSGVNRPLYLAMVLVIVAGIVSTMSRGGFIGLVCLMGFALLKSQAKAGLLAAAGVLMLLGALLVPESYWEEMASIKDVGKGTASQRTETWKIGAKMFLDPRNTVFGIGFNNAPMRMGDYEPKINQTKWGKSFAGRALHSSLFQLLVDTGIVGFSLFAVIAYACLIGNMRLLRSIRRTVGALRSAHQGVRAYAAKAEDPTAEEIPLNVTIISTEDNEEGEQLRAAGSVLGAAIKELDYCSAVLTGLSACYAGVLGAGLFISVLYYPPLWLVAIVITLAQLHTKRILAAVGAMLAAVRIERVHAPSAEPGADSSFSGAPAL